MDKPVLVWSVRGLSKKVRRLGLTVDEAVQLRQSIGVLNTMSVSVLVDKCIVREIGEDVYAYDVNDTLKIMFGILTNDDGDRIKVMFDIIRVEKDKNLASNFVKLLNNVVAFSRRCVSR